MFTFKFNTEETNLVLNALAGRPFSEVFRVIGEIQKQIAEQQKSPEAAQPDNGVEGA